MSKWKYFYIFRIEFLGFRYHGWQKQEGFQTIHLMVDKTFDFIFQNSNFKTLGSGRTDSKVSADDFAFELFVNEPLEIASFLPLFNDNLPSDIRLKSISKTDAAFNIIQNSKTKEYHYHFTSGIKMHPYTAPFLHSFKKEMNIELMQEAVKLFEGTHNFKRYTSKPKPTTILEREIVSAVIEENQEFSMSTLTQKNYVFKVRSKGFMRYQVRLMMAGLAKVGAGEWTLESIQESLENPKGEQMNCTVPPSGLRLHKIEFE